jgi:hypothetical protein
MSELEQVLADIEAGEATQAKRRQWNPQTQGEIDIRIAADGSWFHEGRRFKRDAMVKLFAGILRREGDAYFLVTPVEKLRVQVEDAPFVATLVERIDADGEAAIVFTTNIGERVIVDQAHALRVEIDAQSRQPRPYVHLRDGLDALISRSAFYDLLNLAYEKHRDGGAFLAVTSRGDEFELGSIDG